MPEVCEYIVFCQAAIGIQDLVRCRGRGEVYKGEVLVLVLVVLVVVLALVLVVLVLVLVVLVLVLALQLLALRLAPALLGEAVR